jgi:hypothetical protein
MRKPTPVTIIIMIIESWSSWIAASTAKVPVAIQVQ